jgi:hypothetical protein
MKNIDAIQTIVRIINHLCVTANTMFTARIVSKVFRKRNMNTCVHRPVIMIATQSNSVPIILSTDPHKMDTLSLYRLGWDLGVKSPLGYNNRINEIELGFALYIDDIEENKSRESFIKDIWRKLESMT